MKSLVALSFFFFLFVGVHFFIIMRNTKILAGSSHPELAALVTKRLGTPLSECTLQKFSNKETNVEIREYPKQHVVWPAHILMSHHSFLQAFLFVTKMFLSSSLAPTT